MFEPAKDPLIGQLLSGRYELVSLLGAGGMGRVYKAVDRNLEREVAVKLLSDEASRDEGLAERFRREAKVLASINHPHVLQVFDHGVTPAGLLYLVTELLQGRALNDYLREQPGRRMHPRTLIQVLLQLTGALATVHERSVVHRDLKPHNIFLEDRDDGPSGRVLDFGIARRMASSTMATQQIIGTPPYMSPEQIRTEQTIDGRADLYSLGVVAYECVSGRLPFPRAQVMEILMAHLHDAPPPLTTDECPPELAALIARMLEKVPAARPASARVVREELKRLWEAGVGVNARPAAHTTAGRTIEAVTTPAPRPPMTQSIYMSPRPAPPIALDMPIEDMRTPAAAAPEAMLASQALVARPASGLRWPRTAVLGLVCMGAAGVVLAGLLMWGPADSSPSAVALPLPSDTTTSSLTPSAARAAVTEVAPTASAPALPSKTATAAIDRAAAAPAAPAVAVAQIDGARATPAVSVITSAAPSVSPRRPADTAPRGPRAAPTVRPSPRLSTTPIAKPSASASPAAVVAAEVSTPSTTTGRVFITGITPTGQTPQIDAFEGEKLLGSGVRIRLELPAGRHTLRVRHVGRESFKTRTIEVRAGAESNLKVLLD